MKKTIGRIVVWVTTLALLLPYGVPAFAGTAWEAARAVAAPVIDVALVDGVLHGQLLDTQGIPRAQVPVTVLSGERIVQRAASDKDGRFAVGLQQGGLYVLASDSDRTVVRVWTRGAAPPSTKDAVLLVSGQNVERGTLGNGGILADPRVRVGLAVAAVGGIAAAVVVAVSDSGS